MLIKMLTLKRKSPAKFEKPRFYADYRRFLRAEK